MPLYIFHPCHEDGVSETFVARELPADEAARVYADRLLGEHLSASEVAIWAGDRRVYTRWRRPVSVTARG